MFFSISPFSSGMKMLRLRDALALWLIYCYRRILYDRAERSPIEDYRIEYKPVRWYVQRRRPFVAIQLARKRPSEITEKS